MNAAGDFSSPAHRHAVAEGGGHGDCEANHRSHIECDNPHTRLRRGDCAPPPFPQTPKMVGSRDPLHHSRFAGEMTQGVAFQMLRTTRPITQRASNPLSRSVLHSARHKFAARAQPHGNPGRLRGAQKCWIAHSPRGSGSRFREGCCFALSLCCFANRSGLTARRRDSGDAGRFSPLIAPTPSSRERVLLSVR